MTVRRLADDRFQPAGFAFSAENQAWAEKVIGRYPVGRQQSAVIPILWRAQDPSRQVLDVIATARRLAAENGWRQTAAEKAS